MESKRIPSKENITETKKDIKKEEKTNLKERLNKEKPCVKLEFCPYGPLAHLVYLIKEKPEGKRTIDPAIDLLEGLITEREISIFERTGDFSETIKGEDDPEKMCPIYSVECPSNHVSRNVDIKTILEKEEETGIEHYQKNNSD